MFKNLRFVMIALFAMVVSTAMAQMTTSAMSGHVTDEAGVAVIGANVVAIHTPSGTKYGAMTNTQGRYTIQGMRVGGPYKVTVSYIGYKAQETEGVTLQLGETYSLNATMSENTNQLGEAVVMGKGTKFAVEKTGASTNISNTQILSLPTVNRSLTDVTRLSPYGGAGMSFQGSDGRTANFTVDGANMNNDFGLSSNLPGGGTPISLDAIEEMQVVISPYDVRQTNFIGGGVNAITKSGTNTFKGSVYVHHKNENMRGSAICGEDLAGARDRDRSTMYGFTLGGPIIKNKLFFFVNGEMTKTPTVANRWRASDNGIGNSDNYLSRVDKNDLQDVSDYVREKYGYNTGSFTSFPANETNYKMLARLDWNITDNHHLAVRYNYSNNNSWVGPSGTSMDGGTKASHNRTSDHSMTFANSMYSPNYRIQTVSLDLNSRLLDNLTNQFLTTFKKSEDPVRSTNSSTFPFIDILDGGKMSVDGTTAADGTDNYICLGYELFSWHNAVHSNVFTLKDDITYNIENHKIVAGISYEHQMTDNQYMRNGTGYYRYKSVEDFLAGATPQIVCLTYGYDGNDSPAARVRYNKAGIYAQDEWNATDKFKLTYGLRVDGLFFVNSDLMRNNKIYEIDYSGRHIDTGKWPANSFTFSPRVGFVWDVLGNKSFKVRGGTGLFSGRLPLVFFTNMPTNSGMVQYNAQIGTSTKYANLPDEVKANYGSVAEILEQFNALNGGMITDPKALRDKLISMGFPSTITPEEGTRPSSISAVDPKFKMPQVWKTSFAVDYSFPVSFPMSITAEGIFNKTINASYMVDWSIPNVAGFSHLNGADARPIFPSGFRTGTKAFVLSNTRKGYGWSASVQFDMQPFQWMSLKASYTHTVMKELTSLPGSNAESVISVVPTYEGPNNLKLHNGVNVTPDRFFANLTLSDKCGDHWSIIYETWRGGYNASYMTLNDMNGDGYNYDAIYIPTDKEVANNEFRFASEDDRDRFMAYVHHNKYLNKHQGEYAEAYAHFSPWVHRVDFSYKHDFKFKIRETKHNFQLSVDIKNLMNLFNSSWGVSKILNSSLGSTTNGAGAARILKYEGIDAEGYPVFSTPKAVSATTKTFTPYHAIGQCWYMGIGIKYIFN